MNERHFELWPSRMPRTLTLPETSVPHNLKVSAERYPEKAAIVYYGSNISYRRLRDEVESLAGYLQRDLGVEKGDRVVLYVQNSPQFVVSYYAILQLGGVVVPVNPMLVTEELGHYFEDSGAAVAICGGELYSQLSPLFGESSFERVIVATYSDYLEEETDLALPDAVSAPRGELEDERAIPWHAAFEAGRSPEEIFIGADDMACLPYTSGTTGKPKGCVHTHRTLNANLIGSAVWNCVTVDSVVLSTLPLFHVTGMEHGMNTPIFAGGTTVLVTRWDRELAVEVIERYQITHWTNISTMVVDLLSNPKIGERDLSSLAFVGGGGAALPAAVGEKLEELTGIRYAEGYGLTETIAQTHMNPPDRPKLQCLGIPSFDVDSRVVDPVTLEEVSPGEEGEIVSSGPQVMKGYWKRPEADEEAFFERDGRRFLRTGDIGRVDEEGYFFMVDRLKRMINVSGYNVWPAEVESVLYEYPAIQEAVVISIPDERSGEAAKAMVVLREEEKGEVSEEDIIEWARGKMAVYKCPRQVEFIDELPKSGSGKILWRVLQEREQEKIAKAER
jgi:fatty-acyl-CoA synthase